MEKQIQQHDQKKKKNDHHNNHDGIILSYESLDGVTSIYSIVMDIREKLMKNKNNTSKDTSESVPQEVRIQTISITPSMMDDILSIAMDSIATLPISLIE
eukprot:15351393-Ditylum_brightwellii.AAC.1